MNTELRREVRVEHIGPGYWQERWLLHGDRGVVQFVMIIGRMRSHDEGVATTEVRSSDLGYHWPTPRWEGQGDYKCEHIPSGRCFYDGSSLNADAVLDALLDGGADGVWTYLENYYERLVRDYSEVGGFGEFINALAGRGDS